MQNHERPTLSDLIQLHFGTKMSSLTLHRQETMYGIQKWSSPEGFLGALSS